VKNNSNTKRFYELDALRGIAAILVVLFHFTTNFERRYGYKDELIYSFDFGMAGVYLFFVISGYVIFMSLQNKSSIQFVKGRFLRLYPFYWIAVLWSFSWAHMGALQNRTTTIPEAFVNLSMLQSFFNVKPVDGVYWTLAIELSFYMLIFVATQCRLIKKIHIFQVTWLLVSFIIYTIWQENSPHLLKTLLIPKESFLFIAGISFFHIRNKQNMGIHCFIVLLCMLFSIFLLKPMVTLTVVAIFSLFFLLSFHSLKILRVKPILFLGAISYPLYLLHQNFGYVLIRHLENVEVQSNLTVIITSIVVIAIAAAAHIFIEKPLNQFISKNRKPHLSDNK
jgi:peptidoglycan/LPS O-acetylase OafA/YrhL